jgi:hypothetical protein
MPPILIPLLQANLAGPAGTDLSSNATSAQVAVLDGASTPEVPFHAYLEQGTLREERILVSDIAGATWTFSRGQQGTTGVAHPAGAAITAGLDRDDLLDLFTRLELSPPDPMSLQKVKAWTWDICMGSLNNATTQATGRVLAVKIPLKRRTLITNLLAWVQTAGATLTAGQNLAWLCNSDGSVIANSVTGDQSGVWTSTGGKVMPVAGGPLLVDPGPKGFVWLCLLTVGTTPPLWRCGVAGTAQTNFNLANNEMRCGRDAATGVTAVQAITPGTLNNWEAVWGGIS